MGKLILFRCRRCPLDDVANVVEIDMVERLLVELDSGQPAVVFIGPSLPENVAQAAIEAAVARDAYFLRIRNEDRTAWLKRLVRFALARR